MEGKRLVAALFLTNIIVFFSVGILLFNDRPITEDKADLFLKTLTQPKTSYYLDFSRLSKDHDNLRLKISSQKGIVRDVCYKITNKTLNPTSESCNDIVVELDDHALGTIILSSFHPREALFSEFITGHIKITGLGVDEILSLKS